MTFQTLLCSFLVLLGAALTAQLTPAQAIAEMGRGINLGNTLEPPLEGDWNNGPAEEAYFDAYVDAGFTNVRIPVRWDEHTAETAPYTIDADWLDRVEEVVDWGLERGLYITLNGHHEDWLKNDYGNPATRARYDSIWVQISERFQDKSDKLLFEIINEPFGMTVAEVDDLNARILSIIRENNPTRLVIFGGNAYANAEELLGAAVPEDDYLVGYFHSYDPWSFAGEGTGTWGSEGDYAALDEKFSRVNAWSETNDVPVHLSEFGAVLQADYNSRMRYYAAYVEAALRYGFAFSVWDDGGMFGVLDREEETWPEVKDILINTFADSPTNLLLTAPEPGDTLNLEIGLSWTNRLMHDSIRVERRVAEGEFSTIAKLAPASNTYTDTTVMPGNFYTYRIATNRADGTLLQSYPARALVAAGAQEPYGDTLMVIPGTLQVENFDRGGESVAYHDSESANQGGAYRTDEGVDIGGVGEDGYAIGYLAQGEWLEYTVMVDSAGVYAVDAAVASAVGGGNFQISNSRNASVLSLTVPGDGTGSYEDFEIITGSGRLTLEAGEQELRIDITGANAFNLDYLNFRRVEADTNAIINYADNLDTAALRFSGEPTGITFAVSDGVLTVAGDGSSPAYQTFRYTLPDSLLADVAGSNNLLYLSARSLSGEPVNMRIDLIDENNLATTIAGRTLSITGTEFSEYRIDYAGGYQDGGYGGTGCTSDEAPCSVNGNRIVALAFYPEATTGGFNDTVQIDYLSFGVPLDGNQGPTGIIYYQDELDEAGDQFGGEPAGLTYTVSDGVLAIVGDGTAPVYQTITYDLRDEAGDPALADVAGSENTLYFRARTASGDSANLRIDLVDENNFHTTLAGRTARIGGTTYQVYSLDYTNAYQDGGYGGTACTQETQPCPVDGQRVARLAFYPNAEEGGLADSILIDWLSFGEDISTSVRTVEAFSSFAIYPNPTRDRTTAVYHLLRTSEVRLDLIDGLGRLVQRRRLGTQAPGGHSIPLEVAGIAPGTYFLRLTADQGAVLTRAVLIR